MDNEANGDPATDGLGFMFGKNLEYECSKKIRMHEISSSDTVCALQ